MPLVINSLGRTHTHTHTYTRMHTDNPHKINFKKPGAPTCGRHAPGLKIYKIVGKILLVKYTLNINPDHNLINIFICLKYLSYAIA